MNTCIYLRKSRADEELEKEIGKGETLARHRKALLKYASEKKLNIVEIYEELESGESIIHRPAMLQLLKDIEKGLYDAVLVMDLYRLGRGDLEDQGLILKTLKRSNTRIFTPEKQYDLNNEFDEEYAEFESFMGRKEYKMIRKRLQGGRIRSIHEGNYISTYPPYGYVIEDGKHYRTLAPHPEQAPIIKLIFDMYANQGMGCSKIAKKLNEMGVKSYWDKQWERTMITNMIKNQVYIGKLVWKKKCIRKSTTPGKSKDIYTRDKSEWIVSEGRHPALIDEATFEKAQQILSGKYHVPYQITNGMTNPLAGLLVCKQCGHKMKRRPYSHGGAHVICEYCDNKSSRFDHIENQILSILADMIAHPEAVDVKKDDGTLVAYQKNLEQLVKELDGLNKQKIKIYDLFERDEYSTDVFLERSRDVSKRIDETLESIEQTKAGIKKESDQLNATNVLFPAIEKVLSVYNTIDDVVEKNDLLKSVIEKVEYYKTKDQKDDDFFIRVQPKTLIR
jgi:site-specific DNA recombinase